VPVLPRLEVIASARERRVQRVKSEEDLHETLSLGV
jgi:hypothetical protein